MQRQVPNPEAVAAAKRKARRVRKQLDEIGCSPSGKSIARGRQLLRDLHAAVAARRVAEQEAQETASR